jgi:hypothetical protein
MANFSYTTTATLALNGITPTTGPALTDKVNGVYSGISTAVDDRLNETYTINASTTATALDLGKIVAGTALWIQTDGPLHVSLTQDLGAGPVVNIVRVEKFLMLESAFSAISVANPSATTAVHFSIIAPGNRLPVGGGPGVF